MSGATSMAAPQNAFSLAGKVALVTGAGSGIGRATAALFARLGATVVATDLQEATVQDTVAPLLAQAAVALQHDVTSEVDWQRVYGEIGARFDRLDVLVNNAGIMLSCPFESTPIEDLRRQQRVNVESVFLGMQGALPLMRRSIAQHGAAPSIINLSSIYGQVAGPKFAAYSATKGAVRLLSKAVAYELAATGIRVNSVHPGPTMTNLSASWEPPRDAQGNLIPPEVARAAWLRMIPAGRLGEPSDIAWTIAFLASDAACYITGSELVIDGGYTAA